MAEHNEREDADMTDSNTTSINDKTLVVLTDDIVPFPDPIPARASFARADLNDGVTILRLAEGCGMMRGFSYFTLLVATTAALIPFPRIFPLWCAVVLLIFFCTLPEPSKRDRRRAQPKKARGSSGPR